MYISSSDLFVPEDVLIRLTDDESTGSVNTGRANTAIASAQAVVDAALSTQYATPLAEPPQIVIKLTSDIALYNLYLRSGVIPAEVKDAYAGALGTLAELSDGTLRLPDLVFPGPSFSCSPREFSRESMEEF